MKTSDTETRLRLAVIGGGISGLSATYRLVEESQRLNFPVDVKLFESTDRLGGVIHTVQQDGFLLEGGPDSFISEKPWGLELCHRLGIESHLIGTGESHRRTFIVRQGKLLPIPDGFYLMAPTKIWPIVSTSIFSWRGKLRMAADLVLPRRKVVDGREDESLASFVRRRLGEEALIRMAQPLVGGIYTSDPEELSLQAAMPRFLEMEKRHRSLIVALLRQRRRNHLNNHSPVAGPRYGLFVSLESGMNDLVRSLERKLSPDNVQLNARARTLLWEPSRKLWTILLESGEKVEADGVCLALPAYASADLLKDLNPQVAQLLGRIRYASAATVNLAYRLEDIPLSLDGFGFVVPVVEGREILACTFSHVKFPKRAPNGRALLRVFVGGALQPRVFEYDDTQLIRVIKQNLKELLGIIANPVFYRVDRHPLAMAQYQVGHLGLLAELEWHLQGLPTLQLAGNAFTGIGIPDCIHRGEVCADRLISTLSAKVGSYARGKI